MNRDNYIDVLKRFKNCLCNSVYYLKKQFSALQDRHVSVRFIVIMLSGEIVSKRYFETNAYPNVCLLLLWFVSLFVLDPN